MSDTALKVLHQLLLWKLVRASVRMEPESQQLRRARPGTRALLSVAKQDPAGEESGPGDWKGHA